MRALVTGVSLVFVGACASIAGLEGPSDDLAATAPVEAGSEAMTADALAAEGSVADSAIAAPDAGPTNCDENGLLARWMFDEGSGTKAADCTSGQRDGTLTNATWDKGRIGSGALKVTDGYVDVGNPPALQLTGAMTLSAWVNPSSVSSSGRIISKSSQSDRGWELNIESGGSLEFKVATDVTSYSQVTGSITTGKWRHVAGVYSPGNSMRLYVDGAEVSSSTGVSSTQRNTSLNVQIGAMPDETCCRFQGLIDDVRVYGRALSASEVKALATAP